MINSLKQLMLGIFNSKNNLEENADDDSILPILPVIHGTQVGTAWSIATTGFAALSKVDSGFFGKGMYFTSFCRYAFPYTQFGNNPCMLVALTNPGNVYPVLEQHKGEYSLLGQAITPGYNSHYVRTLKNGYCVSAKSDDSFDELVIEQEAQIVPIFILELDPDQSKEWQIRMNREVVITSDDNESYVPTTQNSSTTTTINIGDM